jgi:NAD(P)-dependent dehydrogenase (short-subunit alcohol dehydrogenase family)
MEVKHKVAVVTGAASGIGWAMCQRFAAAGMRIAMADVQGSLLDDRAAELAKNGTEVLPVATDVSQWEAVRQLEARVTQHFGGAHVLCSNAGVVAKGVAWDLPLEDWKWVLETNLWGTIHCMKAFVPGMIRRAEPAHIVNTASTAGLLGYVGNSPYTVSKFGIVGLSESVYQDLRAAAAPIGVSVLCPGVVTTQLRANSEKIHQGPPLKFPPRGAGHGTFALTADAVAEMVLQAILKDRFWILTNPQYHELIQRRARGIVETGEVVAGEII